jgi:broad specificity phosphatase PhoE
LSRRAADRPAVLALVRHGEIRANVERIWHGSIDSPLTQRGEEQARRVAEHLALEPADARALYASPLRRARDTAAAIGDRLGLMPSVDAALSEYDLGEWEGLSYRTLGERHDFFRRVMADPAFAPPGGESLHSVVERTLGALRRLARDHAGERVIVVGHGGVFGLGLAVLLEGSHGAWGDYQVANCSVTEFVLEPEPRLLCFNRTEHLEPDPA